MPEGIPVLRGSNLSEAIGNRLSHDKLVFIPPELASKFQRSEVRVGDLVFTCWGTIGQVGLIDERAKYDKYIVSNKQMKLTPDEGVAESLFLYYAFSSPDVMGRIQGQKIGSSVPGFNLGQLRSVEILLPPLPEQRRIAAVLGALDDKIELNRRMNRTLEEMAQALFKSWFIDFDGVPPEDLVDSELGPIPRGWEVGSMSAVMELAYGKSLPKRQRSPGCIPVYGSGGIGGYHNESLVEGPGIIVGRKGSVGTVYWEDNPFFPIDTTFYVKPLLGSAWLPWIYYHLAHMDIQRLGADSAVPGVNKNALLAQLAAVPPAVRVDEFLAISVPLRARIEANARQSRTLAELRDTLLPKLISGEIRVPEAEEAVESAL